MGNLEMLTLDELATGFVYRGDKTDTWRILDRSDLRGDCDDYACTALFIATGSMWSFWMALIFGSAKIHYITTHNGVGHAVLQFEGMYIDNWTRKYVTKQYMEDICGHKFHWFWFPFPATALKMALGRFYRG
jgi:hypothetical protein